MRAGDDDLLSRSNNRGEYSIKGKQDTRATRFSMCGNESHVRLVGRHSQSLRAACVLVDVLEMLALPNDSRRRGRRIGCRHGGNWDSWVDVAVATRLANGQDA